LSIVNVSSLAAYSELELNSIIIYFKLSLASTFAPLRTKYRNLPNQFFKKTGVLSLKRSSIRYLYLTISLSVPEPTIHNVFVG
jgi:hypothetical protein